MRVSSDTPFTFAPVPGRIGFPGHSLTLVVKGTFDLHPGGPATPAKDQLYPTGDAHLHDDEERTGPIRYASDFAPWKPACDLLLVGTCHAPGGCPVAACDVAFQVGNHRHVLRVSGDRYWGARTGRWVATEPEPFAEMPLTWARALGGEGYGPNPVGKGLSEAVGLDGVLRRPLPNLEDPAAPVASPDDRPEPAGLGPLPPIWARRRAKLGTYGDDYVERHWPWFPEDFDWAYFNAAPAALQIEGYLRGDEPVVLENLHPEHQRCGSRLPGLRVRCFVTRAGERGEERFDEVEMRLDTLWIDADAERLVLVWRGWTGVADEDFEEVRHAFIVTEPTTEAPRGLDHYRVRLADRLAEEAAGLGVAPAKQPAEGAAAAAPVGAGPDTVTGIDSSQDPATPGADSEAPARSAAAPREPPGGLPPDPDPRDRETAELFESVMARAQAVTGIDLSALDPDAATARIKDYLRQQGIDPDRPPELTPEQRQAQAALFEGLGIPWDPVAGQPDLDRLETMDLDATLRRTLEKLDADLKAHGLPAREEPPPLTPEAAEAMRSIGIDPEALFAYLKSQASTADTPTDTKPVDRDAVRARLLDGRSLGGADLSGQDLSGLDLAGLDLARATLAGANLTGARLAKTRLSGTDLSHANLAGADLSGADLAGARLCEADLTGADLTGADASGADLTGVVAEGCVLREARLYRAIATGAYLAHADLGDTRARGLGLDGADLHGACLDGADLRRASLREARLFGVSAVGALFDYADLTGARVSEGARLADASLRQVSGSDSLWMDSDLTGADLSHARLPEADFSGAVLAGAELHAADLRQARFRKARLRDAGMSEMNLFQASLERADLSGADLSGSNLYGAELLGARLEETKTEGANLRRTKLEGRGA